jgi:hypothetical protein
MMPRHCCATKLANACTRLKGKLAVARTADPVRIAIEMRLT